MKYLLEPEEILKAHGTMPENAAEMSGEDLFLLALRTACQAQLSHAEPLIRKDEAQGIIRCITDAKRVHPDWQIEDVIDLLKFREETRQALEAKHGVEE